MAALLLLMKDKTGIGTTSQEGEELWECKVFKGEIIVKIPVEKRRQVKSVTPNYRLYHDAEVVLYATPVDAVPLDEKEAEYLLAIYPASFRVKEYLKEEERKMKMSLIVGDAVVFKLELKPNAPLASVKGIIRHIGPVPENEGIFFGIEIDIQEQMYRGKGNSNGKPYFTCGTNNAVFVAMDKIMRKSQQYTDKPTQHQPDTHGQKQSDKVFTVQPGPATRSQALKRAATTKSNAAAKGGIISNLKQLFGGTYTPDESEMQTVAVDSKFKISDRVVLLSARGEVITGTVQYVGSVKVSKEVSESPIPVVGVETDKSVDPAEDFPELFVNVPPSRSSKLFKVSHNHSRIFLPEQLVVSVDEYALQQQRDNAAQSKEDIQLRSNDAIQAEIKEAEEFGMTVAAYREQQKNYADLKRQAMEAKQIPPDPPFEDEERLAVGGVLGQKGELTDTIQAIQIVAQGISKEQIKEERKVLSQIKSWHEERHHQENDYYQDDKKRGQPPILPAMAEGMRVPHQSKPDQYYMKERGEGASLPYDGSQDPPPNCSPHSSRPSPTPHPGTYPPTDPLPVHPPPPTDPHHQFTIGSMVRVDMQSGQPLYGVIKWVGTVGDFPGIIAGLELERPLRDATDGTWRGFRFFTCPPGRAYFFPLAALKQDTRYLDQGQLRSTETDLDETARLKEENSQLQVSIKNLQSEKENLQKATQEQIKSEEQKWRDDKQCLLEENKQFRQQIEQEKEQLEADKEKLMEENHQLKEENKGLMYELTDLREAHNELERKTRKGEEIQAQLQSQAGLLSIENMRLKGQVKQLEESSATDIKYWEVSYKQVSTNRVTLGSGGWGKVEVGLLHRQKVAVKMLHSEIKSSYYNQLVRREISMLAKVRHPNLLLFIAGVLDHPSGSPIIITELLDTSLRKAYTDRLIANDRVRISIMRDVAAALNYIHHQKESIIHRDVSSANVLLEARGEGNWKGKLSDFGSANLVQFSTTVGPGAIPYAAPEVPHNQTTKMDVYSYGVLLCEVLLSEFPFKERFPDMLQSLSSSWPSMHQLILSCTKHSVTDRVDMKYVLDTFNEQFSSDASIKKFVPLA